MSAHAHREPSSLKHHPPLDALYLPNSGSLRSGPLCLDAYLPRCVKPLSAASPNGGLLSFQGKTPGWSVTSGLGHRSERALVYSGGVLFIV